MLISLDFPTKKENILIINFSLRRESAIMKSQSDVTYMELFNVIIKIASIKIKNRCLHLFEVHFLWQAAKTNASNIYSAIKNIIHKEKLIQS